MSEQPRDEKSHDFNDYSLTIQLKVFSANFPEKEENNIEDIQGPCQDFGAADTKQL